jgi:hypothetical protein
MKITYRTKHKIGLLTSKTCPTMLLSSKTCSTSLLTTKTCPTSVFGSSSQGFGSNAGMGGGSWQQQQFFGSVPQQQSTGSSSLFGGFPHELAENKNKILFLVLTRNMTINK